MKRDTYQEQADFLKTISHPTRLYLLKMIREGKPCVKDMQEDLKLSQPNISRHLALMRNAGIVESSCRGNKRCYSLMDKRVEHILAVLL